MLKRREIDFNSIWKDLRETIYEVVTLKVNRESWQSRFTDVYLLCVAYPESLVDKLYLESKKFLEEHVNQLLKVVSKDDLQISSDEGDSEALLQRYCEAWTQYSQGVNYLNDLFSFLNHNHLSLTKKHKRPEAEIKCEIGELGLISWKNALDSSLREKIKKAILFGIQAARENKPHQAKILKTVIFSFVEMEKFKKENPLELYEKMVEGPLLEATGHHYQGLAADLLQRCDVSTYIKEVLAGMKQEMERVGQFLRELSLGKLKSVYEKHMVKANLSFICGGYKTMVNEENKEDLKNVYELLKLTDENFDYLTEIVFDHIKGKGLDATSNLQEKKVHNQYVEKMLAVYNKYKLLIHEVFDGDIKFLDVLDKAYAAIVNVSESDKSCKSPLYLVRYCDGLLRMNTRNLSEKETEDRLASSIIIFKYIHDKDIFSKFYAQSMANRLVQQLSYSIEQEELMIQRLGEICGHQFVYKLRCIFTEVNMSGDLNSKFKDYLKAENTDPGISFRICVLPPNVSPWSGVNTPSLAVPIQLDRQMQLFEKFYSTIHGNRKLTWLQHQCLGELSINYLEKTYLVTMQTALMTILLQFENTDSLTVAELKRASLLNSDHLKCHLDSLINFQLLVAEDGTSDGNSVIRLNMSFSNKRIKLRIPLSATGNVSERDHSEIEITTQSVEKEREIFLQAAIVRIMKVKKVLKHNDLVKEVLGQEKISFKPNIEMLKKCIKFLIEKEYIEKIFNRKEYRYLA